MPRLRITITTVVEYDANPENYPSPDPQEMLALDVANASDDPSAFLDMNGAETHVLGEVLEPA